MYFETIYLFHGHWGFVCRFHPCEALDPLELALQRVVSCHVGVEESSSGGAATALNHWDSSLAPSVLFLKQLSSTFQGLC